MIGYMSTCVWTNGFPYHDFLIADSRSELIDHKDRIILVSCSANVVSKYTSFVGVDKIQTVSADKKPVHRVVPTPHALQTKGGRRMYLFGVQWSRWIPGVNRLIFCFIYGTDIFHRYKLVIIWIGSAYVTFQ